MNGIHQCNILSCMIFHHSTCANVNTCSIPAHPLELRSICYMMYCTHPRGSTQMATSFKNATRSPKQGYQWPHKKDPCPPKIKKKRLLCVLGNGDVSECYTGSLVQRDLIPNLGSEDKFALKVYSHVLFKSPFLTFRNWLNAFLCCCFHI